MEYQGTNMNMIEFELILFGNTYKVCYNNLKTMKWIESLEIQNHKRIQDIWNTEKSNRIRRRSIEYMMGLRGIV